MEPRASTVAPVAPTPVAGPSPARSSLRWVRPERAAFGLLEIYGAIGILALLTARFVPLSRLPGWVCPLRRLTDLPCLTCGSTRAFDWLAQGRLLDALSVNPLAFLLAALAAVAGAYLLLMPLRPPRPRLALSARAARGLRVGALLALAFNWGYLVVRALLERSA